MNNIKFKYVKDGCAPKDAHTIDQFFGQKKVLDLPYQTVEAMEGAFKTMNIHDIQKVAVRLGLKPTNERPRLVRACVDQFQRLTKTYGSAQISEVESKPFDPRNY